ncbi:hypothetical protein GCM10009765_73060 [Fodinicola feengrottensis]|uniref:Uncharacterized protein n=1 Tax=Fodinicola feengrottensis TaxID=435914 RepID=A0ABN2IWT3_9ACTN
MTVIHLLVRLYPGPFRDRWGSDLAAEAGRTGPKSWPSLLFGIADSWLHPVIWPATSNVERRYRATAMALIVAFSGWLLGHVVGELDAVFPTGTARGWPLATADVAMLVGLALLAPMPHWTFATITTIARRATRGLAVPATLGAAVAVLANSVDAATVPAVVRITALLCWWLALIAGGIQSCRIFAELQDEVTVPPSPTRLLLGITVVAVALAVPGSVIVASSVAGGRFDLLGAALGTGILLLVLAFVATLRDLRHLTSPHRPDGSTSG